MPFARRGAANLACFATRETLLLTLVVALAGVVRLPGVTSVGIRYDDEAAYVGDARLWHRCALTLLDGAARQAIVDGDKAGFQARLDHFGVDFSTRYLKPCQGYTMLGSAMMFVTGDGPASLILLNAILGTLSILLVYLTARTFLDPIWALAGTLLFAISPYHVLYCRSAFGEATTGFFVLVGTLGWAHGVTQRTCPKRAFAIAALAFGYAATCHFRSILVPLVLVACTILEAAYARFGPTRPPVPDSSRIEHGQVAPTPGGFCVILAGLAALPTICMELLFQAARLAARVTDSYLPLKTFVEAHVKWGGVVADCSGLPEGQWFNTAAMLGFSEYHVYWNGAAMTVLAAFGLLVSWRHGPVGRAFLALVLAHFLALSLQRWVVARALSPLIPVLCLACSAAMAWFVARLTDRRQATAWIAAPLLVLAGLQPLQQTLSVAAKRSELADACAWIADRPGKVLVPDRFKYRLFLERTLGPDLLGCEGIAGRTEPSAILDELRQEGVRWVVLDPQAWHYWGYDRYFLWWAEMRRTLDATARLAAEFSHAQDFRWEFLAEGPGLGALPEMESAEAGSIRVYELVASGVVGRKRNSLAGSAAASTPVEPTAVR